jgi:ankyrin repeat protein
MLQMDSWGSMLVGIKECEALCRNFTAVIDSEKLHTGMEEHTAQLKDVKHDTAQIHSTMLGQAERQRTEQRKEEEEKRKQLWNELLAALFTSNYEDHKERNQDRVKGTCEWSIGHPLFKNWKETPSSSLLWISADPGCGKSVLAKYLVDHVVPTVDKRTTCYFFFKADSSDQRSAANAMCALLRQLFLQRPELREQHPWILEKFSTDKDQLTTSFSSLWDMLVRVSMSQKDGEVICVLDALDECAESDRQQLTRALDKLYRSKNHKGTLKLLATSRPYAHIQREFQLLKSALPTIHLSGEDAVEANKIEQEINLVIQRKVEEIGAKLELQEQERSFLKQELLVIPNRTYLWVTLIFDMIENTLSYTNKRLRAMIETLPRTVDEAYESILNQSPDKEKALRLLHLVVGAVRPLTVKEMRMALAVEPTHSEYASLDLEPEARFAKTVRNLCGLFVTIIDEKIYLLHQTAKEFLASPALPLKCSESGNGTVSPTVHALPANNEGVNATFHRWKHSLQPVETNRILLEVCISYLQLDIFNESHSKDSSKQESSEQESAEQESSNQETDDERVFLPYSASHWTTHFQNAGLQAESELLPLVRKICKPGTKSVDAWLKLYWGNKDPRILHTELMMASYFRLEALVELLLQEADPGLDTRDPEKGRTALSLAAESGSEEIVRKLINRRTKSVHWHDKENKTPFIVAAQHGHLEIVRLLMNGESFAKIGNPSTNDMLAGLWHAVKNGHQDIVDLLLANGVDATALESIDTLTPVAYASKSGYTSIVEKLLIIGVANVTLLTERERAIPLLMAAQHGHEAVVKLLLRASEIDPDCRDHLNRSPLSLAAEAGHTRVVAFLSKASSVDLDAKDKVFGRTPLLWAAVNGHGEVVKQLMEAGAKDIECTGRSPSRTALSYHSERGNAALVKQLLGTGLANPDFQSTDGRTPLSYACEEGHRPMVELLLGTSAVDVNSQSIYGRTPLSYACERGHVDVVRQLLAFEGIEPDLADRSYGRTPLSWAATRGHTEVAQLLLDRKTPDLGSRDFTYNRTPAMWAAANNHDKLAHLLQHTDPKEDNEVST